MIEAPEREVTWEVELAPDLPEIGTGIYSRTLIGAGMLLERDGWCQHRETNHLGQHCIGGAMVMAFGAAYGEAHVRIASELASDWVDLWRTFCDLTGASTLWNDAPERTMAEVIDLLLHEARLYEGVVE